MARKKKNRPIPPVTARKPEVRGHGATGGRVKERMEIVREHADASQAGMLESAFPCQRARVWFWFCSSQESVLGNPPQVFSTLTNSSSKPNRTRCLLSNLVLLELEPVHLSLFLMVLKWELRGVRVVHPIWEVPVMTFNLKFTQRL